MSCSQGPMHLMGYPGRVCTRPARLQRSPERIFKYAPCGSGSDSDLSSSKSPAGGHMRSARTSRRARPAACTCSLQSAYRTWTPRSHTNQTPRTGTCWCVNYHRCNLPVSFWVIRNRTYICPYTNFICGSVKYFSCVSRRTRERRQVSTRRHVVWTLVEHFGRCSGGTSFSYLLFQKTEFRARQRSQRLKWDI